MRVIYKLFQLNAWEEFFLSATPKKTVSVAIKIQDTPPPQFSWACPRAARCGLSAEEQDVHAMGPIILFNFIAWSLHLI